MQELENPEIDSLSQAALPLPVEDRTHGELLQQSHVGWEEESVPGQRGGDGEARSQQLNSSYRILRLFYAQSVCQFSKCRIILIADTNQY